MNSRWQIYRVGLVDFWYYDDEEFYFRDGRMLLRGANGSGKSVTMQSFIPLLLDGNMRPERLDPFGSRARKMENYLLEEGDGREERTGYLYMEFKRTESEEFLTLGMGMRARRNKKLESWYFCITDGRRVGKDFFLYKEAQSKITCTMRELRNRIGEGGRVMETQSEYVQCVNRLLFGFETQEEYKELLELLIQLRTPKLSKDFKPTVINEILSGSLQTLSEDDLRPTSEAIENMDTLKTNLDGLKESIQAAEQLERVYDQYNEIVLYDKALLLTGAVRDEKERKKKAEEIQKRLTDCRQERQQEEARYEELKREEQILLEEKASLADSDAVKLKEQEQKAERDLAELAKTLEEKQRQESEKRERQLDAEGSLRRQEEKNQETWSELSETLEEMEETLGEIPFDDFAFLKTELMERQGEGISFDSHTKLLKSYMEKVEAGKEILTEERGCQEQYSRLLQELDLYQEEKNGAERELLQYENLLHETRQEFIEKLHCWEKENQELHPEPAALQEMVRGIEGYDTGTDYWALRDLAKPAMETKEKEISVKLSEKEWASSEKQREYEAVSAELADWQNKKETEPEREPEVLENRRLLREKGIPHLPFYKVVDFAEDTPAEERARLEEALLHMGILDALIVPEEYREQVLSMDAGTCDRYIFGDVLQVQDSLMEILDIDNRENDLFLYQKASRILSAIGWKKGAEGKTGSWMNERGNYGMGVLEGTVSGKHMPSFIGAFSREQYRQRKIQELSAQCEKLLEERNALEEELNALRMRLQTLAGEWAAFPKDTDLKVAAREFEKREERVAACTEKIQAQKERVDAERKKLDAIRLQVQQICQKCYLTPRLDVFSEALKDLRTYQELLLRLQVAYADYGNGLRYVESQKLYLEEIEQDLDDIRHDLNQTRNRQREAQGLLASIHGQLLLTDYEKIRERLEYCLERLVKIPSEKEASVRTAANLENEEQGLLEKQQENQERLFTIRKRKEWLGRVFEREYALGYVACNFVKTEDMEDQAEKVCRMLEGRFGNRKQSDYQGSLQEMYHRNRGSLLEYQITLQNLFEDLNEESSFLEQSVKRIDILAKYRGASVKFKELLAALREDAEMQKRLLGDKERELFEDILSNTISKKIRGKIQASKRWVEKMNGLMESMQTSSGLTLSLRWKNKRAEKEEQLDTRALVELLQKDAEIMRPEETEQLAQHFRSKIQEARKVAGDLGNVQSFHAIMREVLDYRQWFEFQLECQKAGEKKKELTDRVFFTFSGGEKAMAMYVPLFSAVVAKYAGARLDAPRLISLDEAFAGVDEMNIRDMFRLMVEFEFNFMINSQILWGDYETVPGLAIYQLLRPENARFVSVMRYLWNGRSRIMVTEKDMNRDGSS